MEYKYSDEVSYISIYDKVYRVSDIGDNLKNIEDTIGIVEDSRFNQVSIFKEIFQNLEDGLFYGFDWGGTIFMFDGDFYLRVRSVKYPSKYDDIKSILAEFYNSDYGLREDEWIDTWIRNHIPPK